LNLNIVPPQH